MCQKLWLPDCLINSMHPFGVQGMKQSPKSPRDSFPAFMLVSLCMDHIENKWDENIQTRETL